MGAKREKTILMKNYSKLLCERCGMSNAHSKTEMCFKCGCPLTVKKAMEFQERDKALRGINGIMDKLVNDEDFLKLVKEKLKELG